MKFWPFIILIVIVSCSMKENESHLFDDLLNDEFVVINLKKYKLDSVPEEIGRLKNAKSIRIFLTGSEGWVIYPPLSVLGEQAKTPPFRSLPKAITDLRNLRTLELVGLNLKALPEGFDNLQNLDSLTLVLNKLTIKNEIQKINSLKNLKYLGILGNIVTTEDLAELKKANPGLTIDSGL